MGCGSSANHKPEVGAATDAPPREQADTSQKAAPANHHPPPASASPPVTLNKTVSSTNVKETEDNRVQHEMNNGREKHFFAPHFREATGTDKKRYVVACHGELGDSLRGLILTIRREDDGTVYQKVWTDQELFDDKSAKGKPLEKFGPASFWRGLGLSMNKGDFKISDEGKQVEFSLRQAKEPKNGSLIVELTKLGDDWAETFSHLLCPFVHFFAEKSKKDEEEARAEKEHKMNHHESIILIHEFEKGDSEAKQAMLKHDALEARDTLNDLENKIDQMNRKLKVYKNNGVTELDELYEATIPKNVIEPQEISMEGWDNWNFDAATLNNPPLVHVAWTLCMHYKLVDSLEIDKSKFANFWCVMQSHYSENPYHNVSRAIEVMISTHCIISALGLGQYEGKDDGVVLLEKEDIIAMIIGAGVIDLGHRGLDNLTMKESKQFISNFYNGHFIIEQHRLAVPFETLENQHCNFFEEVDQEREVRETVLEVLFMKANAEMLTIEEKMAAFSERLSMFDWTQKDNVRILLTMAMRCADLAAWTREQSIHTSRLEKLVEEFYCQGDFQIARGLIPAPFIEGSPWTADRTKHRQDFPRGQVQFIETMVIPLFESMQALFPGFSPLVHMAEENKKYWHSQIESSPSITDPVKTPYHLALADQKKGFAFTKDKKAIISLLPAEEDGYLVVTASTKSGVYSSKASEDDLKALGGDSAAMVTYIAEQISKDVIPNSEVQLKTHDTNLSYVDFAGKQLALKRGAVFSHHYVMKLCQNFVRVCSLVRDKDIDGELDDLSAKVVVLREKEKQISNENMIFTACLESCTKTLEVKRNEAIRLAEELNEIGAPGVEEGLVVCVRNPLASPMPVGVTKIPDCRDIDLELFKIVKSCWDPWVEEEDEKSKAEDLHFTNVIRPYTKSEFASLTTSISDEKRNTIWKLVSAVDDWDFDVFAVQREMSGGYTHEGLANQPRGGALFITQYALFYKYGFMRKFNIDEKKMINWLSMIEAGYHPNPYHNSMHAADVLQVSHYILLKGRMIEKYKVTDEDVFCTLFASSVHDYNHPGINNSFHVKTQNYLAVLWNDRSVNENVHASSVFEIMRLEQFDILESFSQEKQKEIRDVIVELVLGTDMGLHAQILQKFKKKLETNLRLSRRHDMTLALTMVVKMADISNCGRPKNLYHAWCNQIADEFFMQGDRERLLGLAVSPFMDRYTTVISRGQTAFMTYIVVPLFECMAEFLPDMSHATELTELNKYFWLENTFW